MIPVPMQPVPAGFVAQVATPGNAWLAAHGHAPALPLPKGTQPPPLWRAYLPQLHASYRGICAYLAVWVEPAVGGVSADHYIAKSSLAGGTYDWANYRLACTKMNARKGVFADVLDPCTLLPGQTVFHLELVTGRVFVDPALPAADPALAALAEATITRLGLDDGNSRAMRARHFGDYVRGDISAVVLQRDSPFVYAEADRQVLL